MVSNLFHSVLYVPIYNLLIFFVGAVPGGDLGLAIIALTLVVKVVLMPLSLSMVRTQRVMKSIEPELAALREKYKDNKEAQARETLAAYKKYKINPFAGLLLPFIQLPVLFALYFVCRSKTLAQIDTSLLYSFVHLPMTISPLFLGLFSILGHSITLALLAAATQFVQARYAIPAPAKASKDGSMQEEFGRAMATQARIILPLLIGFIAYTSAAIALYFVTSNVVLILQEFWARRLPSPTTSA